MGIADFVLLTLVGACIVAAFRTWRKSGGCHCGGNCEGCADRGCKKGRT